MHNHIATLRLYAFARMHWQRFAPRSCEPVVARVAEAALAASAATTKTAREQRVRYLIQLFVRGSEYGRHLHPALACAGALNDKRLVPGLMRSAAFHVADGDYDCRPKWMAAAGLSRQESDEAVPLLISLADHGDQIARYWGRALARKTGQDFRQDKQAWADSWKARDTRL